MSGTKNLQWFHAQLEQKIWMISWVTFDAIRSWKSFSVGSETTATTLSWAVLYMILYPQVQEKIHEEIDEVLDDNEPSLEDRVR